MRGRIMYRNIKDGLGFRIKELRKSKGLTQEKLAERLDITPRQLTRIETGDNFPSPETLAKISYILDVDLSCLFEFNWDREYTVYTTGTDDKPVFEAKERNGVIDLAAHSKNSKNKQAVEFPDEIKTENSDESMLLIAKNSNKPFTIQFKDAEGELSCVKTYYPDGRIDVLMSKDRVENDKLYKITLSMLDKISDNRRKLEFVNMAIAAINNKEKLNEFIIFLKGMELAMNPADC